MRPSSVRAATLVLASLVLSPALLTAPGCGGQPEQPAPQKLDRRNPFERGAPRSEPDPNDPLRNPSTEVPRGRDGEQIPEAEIDAVLAEAAEHKKSGNVPRQRAALRKCANKTPASARCDAELGLTMVGAKNWRATAQYFLAEAANNDDPKADAALYHEVGVALTSYGRANDAALALEKAVAREPSAEHLFALGRALSVASNRLPEAADRIAEARAKDDRIEWLYEEAVLRGQIPIREQAARSLALFEDYVARAKSAPEDSLPAPVATLAGRMAELDALRKTYPSQAEYDAANPGTSGAQSEAPPGEAPTGEAASNPATPPEQAEGDGETTAAQPS